MGNVLHDLSPAGMCSHISHTMSVVFMDNQLISTIIINICIITLIIIPVTYLIYTPASIITRVFVQTAGFIVSLIMVLAIKHDYRRKLTTMLEMSSNYTKY